MITLAVITKDGIRLTPNAKPRPAPVIVRCPRCRMRPSYCGCEAKRGR